MAFNEDIGLFFDTDYGFAVLATFKGETISAIVEDDYYAVPGEEVDISSSQPVAHCRTEDVAAAVQGDALTIEDGEHAGEYVITNVRPDGTGVTVLSLEEAP
ncbi:hypothetical protein [Prosthecochloris sp.]|uniref:head-tail joining protein n=1 Tax=Prosthecochloris sp. TaxID=290513 RepID=UPI0025E4DDDA|nr:hypothetical protein [Prosthecochloris sp.]